MTLANFSTATAWYLSVHVLEDKGGKSQEEWKLRNVSTLAEAQTAADAIIDILESLTAGTVSRARLSQQLEDSTSPGAESSANEQIKLFFKDGDGNTKTTTIPMPLATTAGGTLVEQGEVNQTNTELAAFRQQFLDTDGYLTLSGGVLAASYQTASFQVKSGTIR